jgi:hypothetical protein
MKIIINESQLRLIVENEDNDNLINFTHVYRTGFPPEEWDGMYEHMNTKKKGGKYDGYYINGDVILSYSDVTELNYLVKVEGSLSLDDTPIESLDNLKSVGGYLSLYKTKIESLPMLKYVRSGLSLRSSLIESLPKGLYVGGDLYLRMTPLSKSTTKEELRNKINVKAGIYL